MPNGELNTEFLEFPAMVYPGMFDRELQATISFSGQEITVIVSSDDVVLEGMPPQDTGSVGKLIVSLVDANDRGFLIDLPGEPLGASRRFRIPNRELREALSSV